MAITPNIKLAKLKDEFNKANREKKELIIKQVIKKGSSYLNEYYDYSEKDVREKIGYDIQTQLIDKALMSTSEDIISEITGIPAENLESLVRLKEESCFFDCLEVLIKFNEIDELREVIKGSINRISNKETKIKIGEIFREFRSKHYKLDIEGIFPFSEEYLQECEGMYFKQQCEEREGCIYKEQFK